MATVLKPKRSFTSNAVPSVSDLEIGELAMNVADGKFFTKLNASTIKEVGGASAVNIQSVLNAGNTTTTSINTDGGSFVAQIGTTNQGFYLNSSSNTHLGISWSSSASQYSFRGDSGGNYPLIIDDFSGISILPSSGAASLGYAGSNKLVTTNTGVTVTGAFVKAGGTSSEFFGKLFPKILYLWKKQFFQKHWI